MLMKTTMNFTNPTKYSATVPLLDLVMLYNATTVAHVTARDLSIVPGHNSGAQFDLHWDPLDLSGTDGVKSGRQMVSQYISGMLYPYLVLLSNMLDLNTTATIQTYEGTIPMLPKLGQAMSRLAVDVPLRRVPAPGGDDGETPEAQPHFIQDATVLSTLLDAVYQGH